MRHFAGKQWAQRRPTVAVAALVLAIAIATVIALRWLRAPDAEEKAIGGLPEPERRALYERTLRTLESSCNPDRRPRGLEDFCADQAQFLLKFPECDAACVSLAARFQRLPAR